MFTVKRQNSCSILARCLHHDAACRYQRFLVGQRQRLACFHRRHHRAKTGKAGDPGNDDIDGNARQPVTVTLSGNNLNARTGKRRLQCHQPGLITQTDNLWPVFQRLFSQQLMIATGDQTLDCEPLTCRFDKRQGAGANRTG